jgi:hypothetical protein
MRDEERRATPRAAVRSEVTVFVGSERLACTTVDVGAGGMALSSPVARDPGQFLRVNFQLEHKDRIFDADAVLVRDQPENSHHIWGVRFLGLDPTTSEKLTQFVELESEALTPKTTAVSSARAEEPPPPARITSRPAGARTARAEEPPPPARITSRARKGVGTQNARGRFQGSRTAANRELAELYRDAVKNLRSDRKRRR